MIAGKINLAMLPHVLMKKKSSKTPGKEVEGIFIPIEAADLFKGKDGNVYLDIIAFEAENEEYKQTHAVKQSFPKDKYSKDELREKPFLGSLNAKVGGGSSPQPNSAAPGLVDEEDDLPF